MQRNLSLILLPERTAIFEDFCSRSGGILITYDLFGKGRQKPLTSYLINVVLLDNSVEHCVEIIE